MCQLAVKKSRRLRPSPQAAATRVKSPAVTSSPIRISVIATPTPASSGMRQGEGAQDEAARGAGGEAVQLGADVGRRAGVEEARVAQLLDPGIDEGDAEEEPQGEERHRGETAGLAHRAQCRLAALNAPSDLDERPLTQALASLSVGARASAPMYNERNPVRDGVAGNARLTGGAAAMLLVLLAIEGATIPSSAPCSARTSSSACC